jgi:hypothetical protein
MQARWNPELQHSSTSMDASADNPPSLPVMATPADNNNPLIPRDETAAILDQTFGDGDSFSVDQEGDSGAEVPIGSAMCEKILESTADRSQDENDTSVASAAANDYTGEPTAASTPLRTAMEKSESLILRRHRKFRAFNSWNPRGARKIPPAKWITAVPLATTLPPPRLSLKARI